MADGTVECDIDTWNLLLTDVADLASFAQGFLDSARDTAILANLPPDYRAQIHRVEAICARRYIGRR